MCTLLTLHCYTLMWSFAAQRKATAVTSPSQVSTQQFCFTTSFAVCAAPFVTCAAGRDLLPDEAPAISFCALWSDVLGALLGQSKLLHLASLQVYG